MRTCRRGDLLSGQEEELTSAVERQGPVFFRCVTSSVFTFLTMLPSLKQSCVRSSSATSQQLPSLLTRACSLAITFSIPNKCDCTKQWSNVWV